MAPIIRIPTERELPKGPRRHFVEELHDLYRAARRPQLRKISDRIREAELPGTASKETIRRMLRGETVPTNWDNVHAVLVVLCELAGKTPDACRFDDPFGGPVSYQESFEQAWNDALDAPQTQAPPARGGFSDEPPF